MKLDKTTKDQISRDISNAVTIGELTKTESKKQTRWTRNSVGVEYYVHDFENMKFPRYIYRLIIEQDETVKAIRIDKEHIYQTPRTMNEAFAKLLFMKIWPDVGVF